MSIPKIKITSKRKNQKIELNCDCSTTANFGVVQPTFCREMIPFSKFTIQTASRVLLAGMPVPTFGRMFMKHYHTFVPYNDVCPQYDAFLAGQPYTPSDGVSYYPKQLPVLKLQKVSQYILAKWADFTIYINNNDATYANHNDYRANMTWTPILLMSNGASSYDENGLSDLKNAWTGLFHTFGEQLFYGEQISDSFSRGKNILAPAYGDSPRGSAGNRQGRCLCGDYQVNLSNAVYSSDDRFSVNTPSNPNGGIYVNRDGYVTWEDADFISTFGANGKYLVCFKLTPVGKRIRQILVGLGYQMTPNLPHDSNWLKLLSYYKSFFNLFRPKREISYTSSIGYKLTKLMENPDADERLFDTQGGATGVPGYIYFPTAPVQQFFDELGLNCSYYLKQDYFSMSVLTPNDNYSQHFSEDSSMDFMINTPSNSVAPVADDLRNTITVGSPSGSRRSEVTVDNYENPALMQLAMKVLRYVNKNTVVGRSIHDYIRAHYGLSLDASHDLDSVYKIGESETPISVSELMNSAATEQMELGEFAGRGRGSSGSEVFTFENKNTHGVWLTLSVIIPQSGFYQGVLKENDAIKRFDFFTPEFDAAGYQVLARSEVSLDYPFQTDKFKIAVGNDRAVLPDAAFGFVPRYSHLKVGRNIVNGDLSLRGLRNSMSGYTLDRMIPYDRQQLAHFTNTAGEYVNKDSYGAPLFDIGVVRDSFRQIDPTDHLGNYNRIFYYGRNDYDHFIINIAFEVNGYSPMLSLQDSFDTFDVDDAQVVEVVHS